MGLIRVSLAGLPGPMPFPKAPNNSSSFVQAYLLDLFVTEAPEISSQAYKPDLFQSIVQRVSDGIIRQDSN